MKIKIPAPLFRDPIYDSPTDPTIIWNREERCWWIFYTQRRAADISLGVSAIHGTAIGIASSRDGGKWLYRGRLPGLDIEPGHNTFWAPEVIYAEGRYHMFVSYITGVPVDWDYERHILHYSADNLWEWRYEGTVPLSSDRVIDACVYPIGDGTYKMWYKDESSHSHTYAAVSRNLYSWEVVGAEITDRSHEGPNVFELQGIKWMIVDTWNGQGVYRSDDFTHWRCCGDNILSGRGSRPFVYNRAHHADVLTLGEHAYIVYFTHPYQTEGGTRRDPSEPGIFPEGRTVLQMAELFTDGKTLICDRDKELYWEIPDVE